MHNIINVRKLVSFRQFPLLKKYSLSIFIIPNMSTVLLIRRSFCHQFTFIATTRRPSPDIVDGDGPLDHVSIALRLLPQLAENIHAIHNQFLWHNLKKKMIVRLKQWQQALLSPLRLGLDAAKWSPSRTGMYSSIPVSSNPKKHTKTNKQFNVNIFSKLLFVTPHYSTHTHLFSVYIDALSMLLFLYMSAGTFNLPMTMTNIWIDLSLTIYDLL